MRSCSLAILIALTGCGHAAQIELAASALQRGASALDAAAKAACAAEPSLPKCAEALQVLEASKQHVDAAADAARELAK